MSTEVFASWFRDQLKRRGWHYPDFVAKSSVPYSTVYAWAVGTRRPDPASVDVIADVFGADLDLVLNLAGHRPTTDPIDPNDPRNELIGMIKRIEDWPPLSYEAIHDQLTKILDWQKKQRKAKR